MLTRLRHRAQGQEGFTLIELLVVILIIGILAAVAIPAFLNQKGKAQDSNVQSSLNTAQTAEETYYTSNQGYTNSVTDLTNIEPTLQQAVNTNHLSANTSASSTTFGATAPVDNGTTATLDYVVSADSQSGVDYSIVKWSDGTVDYTCNVPSGSNEADCNPTTGSSGTGTWNAQATQAAGTGTQSG